MHGLHWTPRPVWPYWRGVDHDWSYGRYGRSFEYDWATLAPLRLYKALRALLAQLRV